MKIRIGIIGGGNMGRAIIEGINEQYTVCVCEKDKRRAGQLKRKYGIVAGDLEAVVKRSQVIILAVKPQVMREVLDDLAPVVTSDQLLISIAAGISIAFITSHVGNDKRIIRAMPNTPVQIGLGAVALCNGGAATPDDLGVAQSFFNAVGVSVIVQEHHLDAVTGLSGSGPAYIFLLIEALTDGGVKMGLPRDIAQALVLQTVIGAGRMVWETGEHPGKLKDLVTSPGGTPIAGLHVLENKGVRGAFIDAVAAATERSRELGKALND